MSHPLRLIRTRHAWPSYLVRGDKVLAWVWGTQASNELQALLKTRRPTRAKKAR